MSDTLEIFGNEFSNATGIIATDDNNIERTFIRPTETTNITQNGTYDVTRSASANVSVPIPVQDVQLNSTSIVSQGVANIQPATNSNNSLGVVKVDLSVGGIGANDAGRLYLYDANGLVKAGTERYKAISPRLQHEAAFYGLAKAAGDSTQASSNNSVGTYTDEAINAILTMLGVYNRVITPPSGNSFTLLPYPFSYSFGEMATLTVTVTATSQYHFRFSCPSGAATVLTMTGITGTDTKNSDTVEAGKTYEVDIWAGIALVKEIEVTAA